MENTTSTPAAAFDEIVTTAPTAGTAGPAITTTDTTAAGVWDRLAAATVADLAAAWDRSDAALDELRRTPTTGRTPAQRAADLAVCDARGHIGDALEDRLPGLWLEWGEHQLDREPSALALELDADPAIAAAVAARQALLEAELAIAYAERGHDRDATQRALRDLHGRGPLVVAALAALLGPAVAR